MSIIQTLQPLHTEAYSRVDTHDSKHRQYVPAEPPSVAVKMVAAILVELLCSYIMGVMNALTSLRAPVLPTLPDIFFEFIPYMDWYVIPSTLVIGMGLSTLFFFAFKSAIALQKLLLVHSSIMLIRAVCNFVTSLPDPNPLCQAVIASNTNNTDSIFVVGFFRVVTGGFHVCGDVFFSGHVALCVICALGWTQFTDIRPIKIFVWIAVLVESWGLMAVRFHYSIDIIFGIWVAFQVWNMYDTYILPYFETICKGAVSILNCRKVEVEDSALQLSGEHEADVVV